MPARPLFAVALVVAVTSACSGSSDQAAPTPAEAAGARPVPPTRAELLWLGDVDAWYSAERESSTLAECTRLFEEAVSAAPTERMGAVRADVLAACVDFERGNELESRAFATGDQDLLGRSSEAFARAERRMEAVARRARALRPETLQPLPVLGGVTRRSRVEPLLGRHASRLAGVRTRVRCWSERDWNRIEIAFPGALAVTTGNGAARAFEGEPSIPTIDAGPPFCDPLVRLAYHGSQPSDVARVELAAAVSTLAHEAEHAAGNWDEAVTECYALQRAANLAVALGAERAYAEGLADTYWDEVHPWLADEYQSPECRDGGSLDLRPGSSDWP